MKSGQWTIVIQAEELNFAVERKFSLVVTAAEKVIVTVSALHTSGTICEVLTRPGYAHRRRRGHEHPSSAESVPLSRWQR